MHDETTEQLIQRLDRKKKNLTFDSVVMTIGTMPSAVVLYDNLGLDLENPLRLHLLHLMKRS